MGEWAGTCLDGVERHEDHWQEERQVDVQQLLALFQLVVEVEVEHRPREVHPHPEQERGRGRERERESAQLAVH